MDLTEIERVLSKKGIEWTESETDSVLRYFYEKYYRWVENVCFRRNVKEGDVLDIIQCVLIKTVAKKIFEPSDDFEPLARFESLIRSHTKFCLGNYFRERKRLSQISLDDQSNEESGKTSVKEIESSGISPEKQAKLTEFEKIIFDCLQTLSEKLRQAVYLQDFEGLDYKEMLPLTDAKSENTLRQRVNRGREEMKKCLEKKGINLDYFNE